MSAKRRRRTQITTAELAEVLGLTHKSVLTLHSLNGHVHGLKPCRDLGRGRGKGLRWSVAEVREVLLAPLDRLDDTVRQ